MGEVDAFLASLTAATGTPPAAGPSPTYAAPPTAYPTAPEGTPPATPQARRPDDAVVQEVPGLLSRLFRRR